MHTATTVEQIEAQIEALQKSTPRCSHKEIVGRCPYCDKCEHGATRYMHCEPCHANDDPTWRTAPVTETEILRAERYFSTLDPPPALRRYTPYGMRNYHDTEVPLMRLVFKEWREMKAQLAKQ